jgi:2-dehydro-3-deoxygluconokinase
MSGGGAAAKRTRRIVSIGECMVEFSRSGAGYAMGFAGDTFNTAWYLRRILGADWAVQYLTNLGDDRLSADMLRFMQASGIDTSLVRSNAGASCGLYVISLENGERSFSYWRSASAARTLADDGDRLSNALEGADCAMFSGVTLAILPESGRRSLLACMARLRAAGVTVAFDSNIRTRLWTSIEESRSWISRAYRTASIALPSWSDEADLFGDADMIRAADRIRAAGADEIVVKNGGEAVLLLAGGEPRWIPLDKSANPVDTTGAGDSFNAGYLAARLHGLSCEQAISRAHACASKVIHGHGALVPV